MIAPILWAAVFAGMLVLEGLSLTLRSHDWPSISDMFRAATRPVLGRWLLFALWLWVGWHFFIRGWQFFLRGAGAGNPGRGGGAGGSKPLGQIMLQVVLPLFALYAILMAVLVVGYRTWRAGRGDARRSIGDVASAVRIVPRRFVRYTLATIIGGYLGFVATMGLYEVLAGNGASGIFGSALSYGAFLAFGVALPMFCALAFGEALLRRRSRSDSGTPGARIQ